MKLPAEAGSTSLFASAKSRSFGEIQHFGAWQQKSAALLVNLLGAPPALGAGACVSFCAEDAT
ncbi:MAG: hypothetical protein ACP5R4_04380, partial [Armatimonadota bacterium]